MKFVTVIEVWFGIGLLMVIIAMIRAKMNKQGTEPDALLGWSLLFAGPIFLIGMLVRQYRIKFPSK